MMLHIDGSRHRWLPLLPHQFQELIVVMDDANNDVYYAKLVAEENTRECLQALRHVVKTKGIFCSLYSDRASHFFDTPKAGEAVSQNPTQIARALNDLGIQIIPAYSPEARGRSERLFETWQGRLPHELKFHNIRTVEDANRYILESFLPWHRKNLIKPPAHNETAFTPYRGASLDLIFAVKEQRTVACDNTIRWNNQILQIQPSKFRISFAKCKVNVHELLDGSISVTFGPHTIAKFKPKTIQPSNLLAA